MELMKELVNYVVKTLIHNSPYLTLGILVAAVIQVYIDPEKFKKVLLEKSNVSIPGSVAFGAFTPFCACGTMAVIVAMLTTALPWGPIMAFLTSSPLMSPEDFVLLSGIVSLKFAIALTLASVIIGLGSGYLSHIIEKNTGFLKDQIRLATGPKSETCSCGEPVVTAAQTCCGTQPVTDELLPTPAASDNRAIAPTKADGNVVVTFLQAIRWRELSQFIFNVGVKQILLYFTLFVAIGFLINRFVPSSIIMALFNAKNIFAVPLAAIIGLPLYVNGASSIPLIKALMAGGASGGAMLAFMITGPGTSAGVIAGIGTIMKKRALVLYILFLLTGGIVLGYLYDFLLAAGV